LRFAQWAAAAVGVCALATGLFACPGAGRDDGINVAKLPQGVRDDYAVFAQKCSKCHSLARPLTSGIDDDEYWKRYVERMRRQPASGISPQDEPPILRFLHYYSEEQRKKKGVRL
jgi:hypothetical protein